MKSYTCDRCHEHVAEKDILNMAMQLPTNVSPTLGYNAVYENWNMRVYNLCPDCFDELKNFMNMNETEEE